ncbi:hypothetical protein NEOLI_000740 [Neolecta irregularis DAH-3]|uniref:Uncharacterized protein n=1 Tax=Neolecta irregularis (strain DAH-3) TaxID=1198029 RepID=A0A1U7LWE6_NEOID|nr:hypothetical protein NEOLI_000740 [Neolecta irregularis DAH-3]|eukprot:OLL26949.1 hypothetical protein NEOLI_000740 [Neolecta irregularis DAH-3]
MPSIMAPNRARSCLRKEARNKKKAKLCNPQLRRASSGVFFGKVNSKKKMNKIARNRDYTIQRLKESGVTVDEVMGSAGPIPVPDMLNYRRKFCKIIGFGQKGQKSAL